MKKKFLPHGKQRQPQRFSLFLMFLLMLSAIVLLSFASSSHAISGPEYPNPLTVNSFTQWFSNLLVQIQGIVGWLAVIMIVIGGMIYLTSGGRATQITLAKTIITFALVGFAIAVAAPSLLREIRDIAAGGVGGGGGLITNATPIVDIVTNVMNFALTMIGILATIGFTISGIMYISAGGDSLRAQTAKRMLLYSVIAIAITGASLIILKQVLQLLGG